jgi:hypothetical protein
MDYRVYVSQNLCLVKTEGLCNYQVVKVVAYGIWPGWTKTSI